MYLEEHQKWRWKERGPLRGRPKKTWKRCVEEDMREIDIREETVYNRKEWERLIHCTTLVVHFSFSTFS